MNTKTKELFSESVTNWDGLTKLPGSIVHVPNPAWRVAMRLGWIKKCGDRDVLTVAGYKAA